MDLKIFNKITSEKLKYLFISEFKNKYDLYSISVEVDDFETIDNRIQLKEIAVFFKLDYNGPVNGDAQSIGRFLEIVSSDCEELLRKYPINPVKLKFSADFKDFMVHDCLFSNISYKLDEEHMVDVLTRILYYPSKL